MYCKIIVMGRLTADPELRNTASNIPVTTFSVAVNRPYVSKTGERATDFFNVVAWRNQADFVCKYFKKGNCILVEGRLENREYVDKNGVKQRISEIIAEAVSFTGESKAVANNYGSQPTVGLANASSSSNGEDFQKPQVNSFDNLDTGSFEEIDDDDLPF